jgi:hypothetical protein
MPYGNANQIVKEMAYEVLPVVKKTPVLAGVCGTDPFMIPRVFFQELRELGFAGIQNFPTVGLIDGEFRKNLEETGISYRQEVECVALAREMDLLTTPYVFDDDQVRWMLDAGADILVLHMGTKSGGAVPAGSAAIGASSVRGLDACVERCRAMPDLARSIRKDVLVLCHGGAIAEPDDAMYVLERARPRRLLRRELDGAPADGARDPRADRGVQEDPAEDAGLSRFSGDAAPSVEVDDLVRARSARRLRRFRLGFALLVEADPHSRPVAHPVRELEADRLHVGQPPDLGLRGLGSRPSPASALRRSPPISRRDARAPCARRTTSSSSRSNDGEDRCARRC